MGDHRRLGLHGHRRHRLGRVERTDACLEYGHQHGQHRRCQQLYLYLDVCGNRRQQRAKFREPECHRGAPAGGEHHLVHRLAQQPADGRHDAAGMDHHGRELLHGHGRFDRRRLGPPRRNTSNAGFTTATLNTAGQFVYTLTCTGSGGTSSPQSGHGGRHQRAARRGNYFLCGVAHGVGQRRLCHFHLGQ